MSVSRTDFDGDEEEEEEEENDHQPQPLPEIHLSISTPLTIDGDDNRIAVDASASASKIAAAVVQALKQMTAEGMGVPMIDEDGKPRPLKFEVVAETRVTGNKNVVGERAVLGTMFGGIGNEKKKAVVEGDQDTKKRERTDSEPAEAEVDTKRTRRD